MSYAECIFHIADKFFNKIKFNNFFFIITIIFFFNRLYVVQCLCTSLYLPPVEAWIFP